MRIFLCFLVSIVGTAGCISSQLFQISPDGKSVWIGHSNSATLHHCIAEETKIKCLDILLEESVSNQYTSYRSSPRVGIDGNEQ